MRRRGGMIWGVPLLLFGLASAAAEDEEVRLRVGPIRGFSHVLSQSDMAGDGMGGGGRVKLAEGVVLPSGMLTYKGSGGDASLTLGGEEIVVTCGRRVEMRQGGRSQKLKRDGDGLRPAKLKLANGLKYMLAFPYANLRSTRSKYVYYRSACVHEGRLGGTEVALYDDNHDGAYSQSDTFSINGTTVYAPISELLPSSSKVYRFGGIEDNGEKLVCQEHDGETAKIDVEFRAREVKAQVAFGNGKLNFTSEGRGKTLTVVPGEYRLLYGFVVSRKKKAVAGITAGEMKPTVVEKGKKGTIELGAPFRLVFAATRAGNKIKIDHRSIKVRGRAEEEYDPVEIIGTPIVALVRGRKRTGMGSFETG